MSLVHVERVHRVSLVAARGELDAFTAPELEDAFARAASSSSETGGIVVDLASVSFLDSTALGIVVRALRAIQERGRGAQIVLPDGPARRIFELTTLDRVLPVAPTRAAALAALAAQGDANGSE